VSFDDILILDYIFKNHNKFISKVFNGEKYYWLDYDEMLENLLILNIKKDTLYRKLKKLCRNKILKHTVLRDNGAYSFYGFTEIFYSIFDVKNNNNSKNNHSEKSPNTSTDKNTDSLDNSFSSSDNLQNSWDSRHNTMDKNPDNIDLGDFMSVSKGFFKDLHGDNSLMKDIYNILNNITMLFNNIKSINRFYINNQKDNNNIYNNITTTTTNSSTSSTSNSFSYNLNKDLNPINSKVYSYYSENGFGNLTTDAVLTLDRLVDDNDTFTVIDAMEEAISKGNVRLCYVEGILKNWKINGKKIMKRQYKNSSSNKDTFNNFHQRKYDFDKLEKELLGYDFC
ncbi:DnaD domain protein, partial [Clostridium senegalense]|uniref:DnaD domain protein n=1 Tax=Clostridium senegalense TaxID=1465809 RepID=UPI001C1028AA